MITDELTRIVDIVTYVFLLAFMFALFISFCVILNKRGFNMSLALLLLVPGVNMMFITYLVLGGRPKEKSRSISPDPEPARDEPVVVERVPVAHDPAFSIRTDPVFIMTAVAILTNVWLLKLILLDSPDIFLFIPVISIVALFMNNENRVLYGIVAFVASLANLFFFAFMMVAFFEGLQRGLVEPYEIIYAFIPALTIVAIIFKTRYAKQS